MLKFINFAQESEGNPNPYVSVRQKVNKFLAENPHIHFLQINTNLALSGDTTAYAVSILYIPAEETSTSEHAAIQVPIEI